jgi:putative ABC transport system substrate-binding protein
LPSANRSRYDASFPAGADMKRRQFLGSLGVAAAAWPLSARAQQTAIPVIGLIGSGSAESNTALLDAFRKGLKVTGYVEGQNVKMEYRWAAGNYENIPALVAGLIRLPVNVVVAFDNTAIALAAKAATSAIPIVFSIGTDPIKFGLVSSLSRPEGNVTGVVALTVGLGVKRLQVLQELLPHAKILAMLVNPKNPAAESETRDVIAAAQANQQTIAVLKASTPAEIDAAFASAIEQQAAGLLIQSEPFLTRRREQISALATKHGLPVIDAYADFVQSGGLMSYEASSAELKRISGIYTGRLLKGDKPGNLPVQQSTKIELLINLKAAQALGLTVPTSLLVRADEVIE